MNKENEKKKQNLLITGVSGLIGRLYFFHLFKNYSEEYFIYGLDQHQSISSRYRLESENENIIQPDPIPIEHFIQCDITNRNELFQIIQNNQIDIIIHLAAILETEPNIERILHVNIEGTRNILDAPHVQKIINASSVMTVFGYLQVEPYCLLIDKNKNEMIDKNDFIWKNLHLIHVKDDSPMVDCRTPNIQAYSQSKIIGEQLANESYQINPTRSIINVRFGWVNTKDKPGTTILRSVWLSQRDACHFLDQVLKTSTTFHGTYFVLSNNDRNWIDLNPTKQDLHFQPKDRD